MRAKKFFIKGRVPGSICLAVLAVILFTSASWAQYIPRPEDTLKVMDASGPPGDTTVWVSIYLRNSLSVQAYTFRLVFDQNLIVPRETTIAEDTFIVSELTERDSFFVPPNGTNGGSRRDTIITFFAGALFSLDDTIASGAGPVARIQFKVNPGITQDTFTVIRLEGDPDYPASYNVYVHTEGDVTDQYRPTLTNGIFYITAEGPPDNHVPVIDPLASQFEVFEGQTLSFTVSASDEDGDTVTLSADALPPNATFAAVKGDSTVSQIFSFSPDFTQGPDVISVTFRARDEHGASSLKTVTITINEVPQDLLIVSSDEGGVPGSTGKLVPLILTNLQDVYGVQFTLHFDSSAVQVDSFVLAERINGFNINSNLGDSSNQVTVLIYGFGNEIILPGSDTVLYFALSVDSLAPFGETPLTLTDAWEAISIDPDIPAKELEVANGFFSVDRFGDINLDKQVNIGDVVSLIAYILGNVSLNTRQAEAADINRDGDVNVGDLVGVINTILGRPINAPLDRLSEPLAYLHLEYGSLMAGSSGEINVWADLKTPVAGVQLKIEYDPEQLSFSFPELTSRSTGFDVCYEKDEEEGNLTVIFYRYYGQPIDPGPGSILSLPVVTSSDFDKENLQIQLKEAILADPGAVVIPVDKGEVILPKFFNLSQNYPNPFNPNTTIRFEIGSAGGSQEAMQTTLKIYNILGQVVKTLVDKPRSPGVYHQTWDSKNEQGEKVSSGIYFYQLRVDDYNETKKMVLLK